MYLYLYSKKILNPIKVTNIISKNKNKTNKYKLMKMFENKFRYNIFIRIPKQRIQLATNKPAIIHYNKHLK